MERCPLTWSDALRFFSTQASFESLESWWIPLEARLPETLAWKGQAPVMPCSPPQQLFIELWDGSRGRRGTALAAVEALFALRMFFFSSCLDFPGLATPRNYFEEEKKQRLALRHLCQTLAKSPGLHSKAASTLSLSWAFVSIWGTFSSHLGIFRFGNPIRKVPLGIKLWLNGAWTWPLWAVCCFFSGKAFCLLARALLCFQFMCECFLIKYRKCSFNFIW